MSKQTNKQRLIQSVGNCQTMPENAASLVAGKALDSSVAIHGCQRAVFHSD